MLCELHLIESLGLSWKNAFGVCLYSVLIRDVVQNSSLNLESKSNARNIHWTNWSIWIEVVLLDSLILNRVNSIIDALIRAIDRWNEQNTKTPDSNWKSARQKKENMSIHFHSCRHYKDSIESVYSDDFFHVHIFTLTSHQIKMMLVDWCIV